MLVGVCRDFYLRPFLPSVDKLRKLTVCPANEITAALYVATDPYVKERTSFFSSLTMMQQMPTHLPHPVFFFPTIVQAAENSFVKVVRHMLLLIFAVYIASVTACGN